MNYKIDEGNVCFPEMQQMNDSITRIYFDHNTIKKEDIEETIYTAKFVDVIGCPKTALDGIKEVVLQEIQKYDKSSAINEFIFNGISMWLDSETRDKLTKRLTIDSKSGLSVTKIIYDEKSFELPIEEAENFILKLEQYARDCFDKTNEHKSSILSLNTVSEVANYDYTVGYPSKLSFNF